MYLFKSILPLALLPAVALAQDYGGGGGSGTTTSSPSAPSAPPDSPGHMNVDVYPNGQFTFKPANINATNGTLVTFYFPTIPGLKHSVTQSSFASPCTHLEANTTANTPVGFDSSLISGAQFTINITDDRQPIWFHCKFFLHCGMGMVGSINAPLTGNTFDAFLAKAKAIGGNEPMETDTGVVTGGVGAVATAAPASNGSTKVMASVSLYFVILVLLLL